MAIFNNFPYTDFHELNLDWLIQQMKKLEEEWKSVPGNVSASAEDGDAAAVTVTGTLLDTLDFHFVLPRGEQGPEGPEGPQGPSGNSFVIKGLYATLADLQTAHPTGSAGDAYAVGDEDENTTYIWDIDQAAWIDVGPIRGPKGDQGDQGIQGPEGPQGPTGPYFTPSVDAVTGDISWTNNGGLTNPTTVNIKGPQGIQGPEGPTGPQGSGLEILDLYATLADLQTDHPTGSPGDCYAVGSSSSNTLYIWSDSQSSWVEIGPLKVSFSTQTLTANQTKTIQPLSSNTVSFPLPAAITSIEQIINIRVANYTSGIPMIQGWSVVSSQMILYLFNLSDTDNLQITSGTFTAIVLAATN